MRRKVALTAAAVAMVGTLAVGGTLAWFTDTETATNVITTGNVDVRWFENDEAITDENPGVTYGEDTPVTPGQELKKEAKITNEGKNAAFVRAKINIPEGYEDVVLLNRDTHTHWSPIQEDGYFYYLVVLNPGDSTDLLLNSLIIADNAGNEIADLADDDKISVILDAEAIQSDNTNVSFDENDLANLAELKVLFENEIVNYDSEVNGVNGN